MARPSPRTLGCAKRDPITGECLKGESFTKFGTQQLVRDPTSPPGVREVDVGQTFKGFTTTIFPTSGLTTAFSQQFQSGMTGVQRTVSPEVAREMQTAKLESMGIPSWQFPDLTTLFPPATPNGGNGKKEECHLDDNKPFCAITQAVGGEVCECPDWFTGKVTDPTAGGRGCECEACKNGTGQCSDKVPHCDAWDLLCEGTGGASKGIVGGTDVWLWVKIILVLIGVGILLWLLRPLFGIAKNITEK